MAAFETPAVSGLLLSSKDAASVLGLDEKTLCRWVKNHGYRPALVGRQGAAYGWDVFDLLGAAALATYTKNPGKQIEALPGIVAQLRACPDLRAAIVVRTSAGEWAVVASGSELPAGAVWAYAVSVGLARIEASGAFTPREPEPPAAALRDPKTSHNAYPRPSSGGGADTASAGVDEGAAEEPPIAATARRGDARSPQAAPSRASQLRSSATRSPLHRGGRVVVSTQVSLPL